MRKLFLALLFLCAAAMPAKAGVPCSVPFNLTNGTTADATQVMANYNAILTCLSTSAAANGSNSDITALNGLTTPLTATQAPGTGLCGVSGLSVANNVGSPTTQLTIKYSQGVVINSLGSIQQGGAGTLTLNFGTAGVANGLDTGSLSASTFYYLYLIGNGTTIASLGSLSNSAPTLPSGYTYSCRIGVWETGTGSALLAMFTSGRRTSIAQRTNTNVAAGALSTSVSAIGVCTGGAASFILTTFAGIPPTAGRSFGSIRLPIGNNGGAYVGAYAPTGTIPATSHALFGGVGLSLASSTYDANLMWDLVLPSSQQVYVCMDGGGSGQQVIIEGWEDAVNAN